MPATPVDLNVVIIRGGPAGLTAPYIPSTVLEADNVVGGLACTVDYKSYLFDIGGHRFFTKWDEVNAIWREIIGDKFSTRPRLSKIFYRGKFFHYPLKATEVLFGLDTQSGDSVSRFPSYAEPPRITRQRLRGEGRSF